MFVTDGKGIDIVLAGLGVSHIATIWTCLARNGKLVLTGGADMPDMAVFDISVFSRGATLSSFDFMEMISVDPVRTAALMRKVLKYYRDGQLQSLQEIEVFDIAELGPAVKRVISGTCFKKVLLSCGPESIVPVSPLVHDTVKEFPNGYHDIRCNPHIIP